MSLGLRGSRALRASLGRIALVAALLPLAGCSADERAPDSDAGERRDAISMGEASDSVASGAVDSIDTDGAIPPLTPDGWGPLRIGMSRAEVVAVIGEDAHPERVGGPEPEVCDEFRPTGAPEGMLLMVRNDTLTRITLMRASRVRTEHGFTVGDSASAILAAYGQAAESTPHEYRDAPSAYITVWAQPPGSPAPTRGIVYDIGNAGRVSLVHAGDESITYVEGCV